MTDTVQVNIYTIEEALSQGLVSPGYLADIFLTSTARIHVWIARRSTSDFPPSAGFVRRGDSLIPVYDFTATVEWYGNRNPTQEGPPDRDRQATTRQASTDA